VTPRLLAGASSIVLLLAACGGNSVPASTPTLAPPPISPSLRALGNGTLSLDVPAKGSQQIDTGELASQVADPPSCARFVLLFSWQVQAGRQVRFEGTQDGKTVDVGHGQTGQASVGCMLLEAVNDGSEPLTGSLRYFVAEAP
jgi:hypothetical protein